MKGDPYKIIVKKAKKVEIKKTVLGLRQHTKKNKISLYKKIPLTVLCYKKRNLLGCLDGAIIWDWLYIDLLWVDEEVRESGIGTELIQKAEEIAKTSGLVGIYLWTGSWQAPGFYKKLGYKKFTEFSDFPRGHKRFGFRKYL